MNSISELHNYLSQPRRIAITTHQNPDGDAMGSSLGLLLYLKKGGHRVKVITPTDYPDFLKWLPANNEVIVGPHDEDAAKWTFESADLIFCLDFNDLKRIAPFDEIVAKAEGKKILIDHHLEPSRFEDLAWWDDSSSSTAEMVFRLIAEWQDMDKLDTDIATCLYTGLMTDTGSFGHSTTTPEVHQMAATLIKAGVNPTAVRDTVMGSSSESRIRFLGHCLKEGLKVLPEYRTAYIMVDKPVFKKYNVQSGDTEGLVTYALNLKDVDLGILLTAREDYVKLSFRSRNEVSASELAQQFGGGGHFYAAGGRSDTSLEETEAKLLGLLKERFGTEEEEPISNETEKLSNS